MFSRQMGWLVTPAAAQWTAMLYYQLLISGQVSV